LDGFEFGQGVHIIEYLNKRSYIIAQNKSCQPRQTKG
jgi:hypothetical protein